MTNAQLEAERDALRSHTALPPLGCPVKVTTVGGTTFMAARRNLGLPDCDWCWCAEPGATHPDCWSGGVCWRSNENEAPSDPVVTWELMTDAQPQYPALGILNDVDAPEARMIVLIAKKRSGLKAVYVNGRIPKKWSNWFPCNGERFTALDRFGVLASVSPDGFLQADQVTASTATYPDGKPRRWQGDGRPNRIVVASKVLRSDEFSIAIRGNRA